MKKIKTILFLLLSAFFTLPAMAQLKNGDFVYTFFSTDEKIYVAEVTAVNGSQFTSRFLHSQSVYKFKDFKAGGSSKYEFSAVVESTAGGAYKKGTNVTVTIHRPDYGAEITKANFNTYWNKSKNNSGVATIAAQFPDGKKYLGSIQGEITDANPVALVTFWHTNSVYEVNMATGKVVKSGGSYKAGTKVRLFECNPVTAD